jgi:hypothetical protein
MLGSNQRPPPCRDGALPAELIVLGKIRLVQSAREPQVHTTQRAGSGAQASATPA